MSAAAFLLPSARRRFATAAAFERDERARLYPGQVQSGKIAAATAEADYEAWAGIAAWCAGDPHRWCELAAMAEAAEKAVRAGERALAAGGPDPVQHARLEAVRAIHALLAATRDFCARLSADLRVGAAERKRAA